MKTAQKQFSFTRVALRTMNGEKAISYQKQFIL
jgi:hypothetical protein